MNSSERTRGSCWGSGTQNHEGLAGVLGAIEYFEWVGKAFGNEYANGLSDYRGRRLELKKAMAVIQDYELELGRALLSVLGSVPGLRIYGLTDENRRINASSERYLKSRANFIRDTKIFRYCPKKRFSSPIKRSILMCQHDGFLQLLTGPHRYTAITSQVRRLK